MPKANYRTQLYILYAALDWRNNYSNGWKKLFPSHIVYCAVDNKLSARANVKFIASLIQYSVMIMDLPDCLWNFRLCYCAPLYQYNPLALSRTVFISKSALPRAEIDGTNNLSAVSHCSIIFSSCMHTYRLETYHYKLLNKRKSARPSQVIRKGGNNQRRDVV